MLNTFGRTTTPAASDLEGVSAGWADIVWADLVQPTRDEELRLEALLGFELPTREDMGKIETSSRLYLEGPAAVMTADIAFFGGEERLQSGPVTFALTAGHLVTVRYVTPTSFDVFTERLAHSPGLCVTSSGVFTGLLEVLVDRMADLVETTARSVEALSRAVFTRRRRERLEVLLLRLGDAQNDIAKVQGSLLTLSRLTGFAATLGADHTGLEGAALERYREAVVTLSHDVTSISDHANSVSGNIGFLLDAALGLINIEQNRIVKVISITSAVFLPLTLIASIYGMNFEVMPMLHTPFGFWAVIGAMVALVVALLVWMKAQRWI